MSISTDTRFESYQKVDKNRMYGLILSTLKEHEWSNCQRISGNSV